MQGEQGLISWEEKIGSRIPADRMQAEQPDGEDG
jgi:hypothetical protein